MRSAIDRKNWSSSGSSRTPDLASVAYCAKPGPGWIDLKVEATARYFYTQDWDSIFDHNRGRVQYDLLTSLESDYVQSDLRGLQLMTSESDIEAIRTFARETSDQSALRELATDLLKALSLARQGDTCSSDEIIESWADTVEIECNPEAMMRIERGLKQAESGMGRVWKPRTRSN